MSEVMKAKGLKNINCIFFDCYMTLIDIITDEDSLKTYEFVSNWLIYHGVRIPPEKLRSEYRSKIYDALSAKEERYPEVKLEDVFSKICNQYSMWEIDEKVLGAETAVTFRSASLKRLQIYPQSRKLLEIFKNIPMAVVSNGQRVFSETELKYLGVHKYFKFIIFSSDMGYKKPDSRIFIEAINKINLEPEEILYIGDNFEDDLIPSTKLGMKAMHIEEAWRIFS
jgi:putative hydrolase of the HAD superfamily